MIEAPSVAAANEVALLDTLSSQSAIPTKAQLIAISLHFRRASALRPRVTRFQKKTSPNTMQM